MRETLLQILPFYRLKRSNLQTASVIKILLILAKAYFEFKHRKYKLFDTYIREKLIIPKVFDDK